MYWGEMGKGTDQTWDGGGFRGGACQIQTPFRLIRLHRAIWICTSDINGAGPCCFIVVAGAQCLLTLWRPPAANKSFWAWELFIT